MDFLSLAQATSPNAIYRFLRNNDYPDEDDFAQLDTSHTSHHDNNNYQSDSIMDSLNMISNIVGGGNDGDGGDLYDNNSDAPILSPAAEAELFMLATNFLLCKLVVSLIIIGCSKYNDIIF